MCALCVLLFLLCTAISSCCCRSVIVVFFFFKQKTAYEMRISDWSSDVCSSDLNPAWVPASGALCSAKLATAEKGEIFLEELERDIAKALAGEDRKSVV